MPIGPAAGSSTCPSPQCCCFHSPIGVGLGSAPQQTFCTRIFSEPAACKTPPAMLSSLRLLHSLHSLAVKACHCPMDLCFPHQVQCQGEVIQDRKLTNTWLQRPFRIKYFRSRFSFRSSLIEGSNIVTSLDLFLHWLCLLLYWLLSQNSSLLFPSKKDWTFLGESTNCICS